MAAGILNQCGACGEDFTSIVGFDRHRVGVHAYTYSEGLKLDLPREDGRRCLDTDELKTIGLTQNQRGQWFDPIQAARTALWATTKRAQASESEREAA